MWFSPELQNVLLFAGSAGRLAPHGKAEEWMGGEAGSHVWATWPAPPPTPTLTPSQSWLASGRTLDLTGVHQMLPLWEFGFWDPRQHLLNEREENLETRAYNTERTPPPCAGEEEMSQVCRGAGKASKPPKAVLWGLVRSLWGPFVCCLRISGIRFPISNTWGLKRPTSDIQGLAEHGNWGSRTQTWAVFHHSGRASPRPHPSSCCWRLLLAAMETTWPPPLPP